MGFPSNIGKIRAKAQGAWGTAATDLSDSTDLIQCKPVIPQRKQAALTTEPWRGGWHAFPTQPGSKEGAEFTLESDAIHGLSFSALVATVGAVGGIGLFFQSVLGGRTATAFIAALESSGQAVDSIKVPNTQLADSQVGLALLVSCTGVGRKWAWLKSVINNSSPEEGIPWNALPAAPVNSSDAIGAEVFYATNTQPTPFTLEMFLGDRTRYEYIDCVCTAIKITTIAAELHKVSYTIRAGTWSPPQEEAWTIATYADAFPELPNATGGNGTQLALEGHSGKLLPQVELDLAMTVEPAKTIGGTDGFAKYKTTGRSQTVTITELIEDSSIETYAPGTKSVNGLQVDLCTTAGRAASYFGPTPQLVSNVEDADASGLVTRKRVFNFRPTLLETPTTGPAANTHFRLARA